MEITQLRKIIAELYALDVQAHKIELSTGMYGGCWSRPDHAQVDENRMTEVAPLDQWQLNNYNQDHKSYFHYFSAPGINITAISSDPIAVPEPREIVE